MLSRKVLMILLALGLLFVWPPVHGLAGDPPPVEERDEAAHSPGEEAMSGPSEEAVEREQGAGEDPMAQRQAELADKVEEWEEEPNELRFYGSARLRYRRSDRESIWGDGGSRIGLSGQWQFRPRSWLFGRAEAGFNLLDAVDQVLNPKGRSEGGGGSLFKRLLYAGYGHPKGNLAFGKNWSAWYQISSFTDRFESFGGQASGTYNARTDGGNTGTGRADRVLQTRLMIDFLPGRWFKPFNLNLQIQHGEPIPQVDGRDYGTAFGVSAVLQTLNEYTFGLAYNRADIPEVDDPAVRAAGIDGDAQAFQAGTRWFGERWYLGTVVARLENHETTNEGIYFDGWGWEVYGNYRLTGPLWLVVGWNLLEPDSGEGQAGDYRLRYGVLGLWYSFREFRQMIYFEARIDDSRNADGEKPGSVYTVGVRWDLP
jgi:predicted porin